VNAFPANYARRSLPQRRHRAATVVDGPHNPSYVLPAHSSDLRWIPGTVSSTHDKVWSASPPRMPTSRGADTMRERAERRPTSSRLGGQRSGYRTAANWNRCLASTRRARRCRPTLPKRSPQPGGGRWRGRISVDRSPIRSTGMNPITAHHRVSMSTAELSRSFESLSAAGTTTRFGY